MEVEGDAGTRAVLNSEGCKAAVQSAFSRFGRYGANEKAWQGVTRQLLTDGAQELMTMAPQSLYGVLRVLAEDVRLTQGSFWEDLTDLIMPVLEKAELQEMIEVAELFTKIQAWQRPVFVETISKVRREQAMHWMQPADMARLMGIFSKAGSGSRDISGLATTLFNEMEDRVLEDATDFEVDDCISLVGSMARFRATKTGVLQLLGREVLHEAVTEGQLHGPKAAEVCRAYGELGWRHDTVFRAVVEEVLMEHDKLQRARVLGEALPAVQYSASDMALVADSLLQLKMYKGNTTWFKWGNNYNLLLDVLTRRLEAEIDVIDAEPLAAAAYVLGRAKRGSDELTKLLYARMMHLLERAGETEVQPQDHLARFLHGLVMMGNDRRKDLDPEWLMQWLCNNVYTFVLSDFIAVNRYLVMLKCYDREYLQMLVPFYCEEERMNNLQKLDIMHLTHTYNGARIREDDMPDNLGKHFMWALGRRWQKLLVESQGRGRRPALKRIG